MKLALLKDTWIPRMSQRLMDSAVAGKNGTTWRVTLPDFQAPLGSRASGAGLAAEDLYQGRLGIAWTLLEAARYLNDERIREFALGVLKQSLRESPDRENPLSAYTGGLGAGWVAARAHVLTEDRWFLDRARHFVHRALKAIPHDQGIDVIAGAAGIVPCALDIARWLDDDSARVLATAAGNRILHTARIRYNGWSWRAGGGMLRQELCGYGHGVSGFVFALLELFAATGDAQWAFGAMRGLSYEHQHFRDPSGDWPDFRDTFLSEVVRAPDGAARLLADNGSGSIRFDQPPSMRAWCHGSPGALPVRRRARQLGLPLPFLEREAELAAAATRLTLLTGSDVRSFSLCHGISGNGECLLAGPAEMIAVADRELVLDQLIGGFHTYEHQGREWPSGATRQLPDPSLMVGDSGVLLAALRMLDDTVPSVLFRTDWRSIDAVPTDFAESITAELMSIAPYAVAIASRHPPATVVTTGGCDRSLREELTRLKTVTSTGSHGALIADALVPVERRLAREDETEDFGPLLLEELLLRFSPVPDSTTFRVIRASNLEILSTRWAWREWQQSSPLPDEQEEHWILLHRNGRIELEALSALEALAIGHAKQVIEADQLVTRIAAECEAVDLSAEQLEAGIRNVILILLRRGILLRAISGE